MSDRERSGRPQAATGGGLRVRPALVSDIEAMNRLAIRAKAHWGYAAADLVRWEADLRVRPDTVTDWPTFVAEFDGVIAGFVQIDPTRTPWALDALWVDPARMGRGIGGRLLSQARAVSAASGQKVLSIDADPHAAGFYRKCGARQVGVVAAPVTGDPHRLRPLFEIATTPAVSSLAMP